MTRVIYVSRTDAIDELVEDFVEDTLRDLSALHDIARLGLRGFEKYTLEELTEGYNFMKETMEEAEGQYVVVDDDDPRLFEGEDDDDAAS